MPRLVNAFIVAAMATGIFLAFTGSHTLRWSPPPVPPRWEAPSRDRAGPDGREALSSQRPARRAPHGPTAAVPGGYQPAPMARSAPVTIHIPAIKVRARVISLGMTRAGAVAVPPLTKPALTSWYDRGPTPGEPGAAVVFGHVDSAGAGPAVFYDLGELRPSDLVYITLKDRRTALFRVYSAALYQKANFPAQAIYGYTSWPSLRLVTCGGQFDRRTGHYLANIVVFAQYLGQRADAAGP